MGRRVSFQKIDVLHRLRPLRESSLPDGVRFVAGFIHLLRPEPPQAGSRGALAAQDCGTAARCLLTAEEGLCHASREFRKNAPG